MTTRHGSPWSEVPPPLELGQHPAGSSLCFGPPSSRETDPPGYGEPTAQAFLAEFGPGFVLGVHFHRVPQFQWFVRGSGRFGGHDVCPGTVHFADPHTPYGPLESGPDGVAFMTLRTVSDSGAHFMPEARVELREALGVDSTRASRRRNLTWNVSDVNTTDGRWVDLCVDHDQLRVRVLTLEEGHACPPVRLGGTGGYLAMTRGILDTGRGLLTAPAFLPLAKGETVPSVVSGQDGCSLMLLQLPETGCCSQGEPDTEESWAK